MMRIRHVLESLLHNLFTSFPILLLSYSLEKGCVVETEEIGVACLLNLKQVAVYFAHGINQKLPVVSCVEYSNHRVPHLLR